MHQMIPHHENAVNMAKALLKNNNNGLDCYYNSETGEQEGAEEDCEMVDMMWSIINGQNHQITMMRKWLEYNSEPESLICALEGAYDDDSYDDNGYYTGHIHGPGHSTPHHKTKPSHKKTKRSLR
jgi:hypothetical protein